MSDTDMTVKELRDEIDRFDKAAEIAEEIDYDDLYDPGDEPCHTCGGDGWGIVGVDWDSDDPINGPYDGEIEKCPNCKGSGLAKDCWYW